MRFTKDHQWIETEGAGAKLGITAYAADRLGDVIRVALPPRGVQLKAGDAMGEVESVRVNSELAAPVDGTVVELNTQLFETPELVNAEPETLAWLVRLALADPAQLDGLMDRDAYEAYLDGL